MRLQWGRCLASLFFGWFFYTTKDSLTHFLDLYGCFQKYWYPKMDGLKWKTPIKIHDLGVPLFLETPIYPSQDADSSSPPGWHYHMFREPGIPTNKPTHLWRGIRILEKFRGVDSLTHGESWSWATDINGVIIIPIDTSWWFQPIWKILVKLDHFPK